MDTSHRSRHRGGRGETPPGAKQGFAVSIARKRAVDESLDLGTSESHSKAHGFQKGQRAPIGNGGVQRVAAVINPATPWCSVGASRLGTEVKS